MADTRHFGLGEESTYGTGVVPTTFFRLRSESLHRVSNDKTVHGLNALSPEDRKLLNEFWEGDVQIDANYEDIGVVLKHLLGAPVTSGAGPYTHTFPPVAGPGKGGSGLSAEPLRDSLNWRYAGGKIDGLSHEMTADDISAFTLKMFGKDETNPAKTTESLGTFTPIMPGEIVATFDGTDLEAIRATLNIDFPVRRPLRLGATKLASEPLPGPKILVTGEIEVEPVNLTQYDKWASLAAIDLAITCTGPSGVSLTYNMNDARLIGDPTPKLTSQDDLVRAVYGFESMSDAGHAGGENIEVVLINNVASY